MENMRDYAIQQLADAIVLRACIDYRAAIVNSRKRPQADDREGQRKKRQAKNMVDECEVFFRSSWFSVLTGLDGKYLMDRIKNEALHRPWYQPDLFQREADMEARHGE